MQLSKFELSTGQRVWLIENFFEQSLAKNITQYFISTQSDSTLWQEKNIFSHYQGRSIHIGSTDLIKEIEEFAQSQEVKLTIGSVIDKSLEFSTVDLWIDRPGYQIQSHCDLATEPKLFYAIQIYMADELIPSIGTMFHSHDGGPLFNLVYKNNCGYVMDRGDKIFHSLNPVPNNVDRYSVHIKYWAT
jgi:hypothetical protein